MPNALTPDRLDTWFLYHRLSDEQRQACVVIREKARELAGLYARLCPASADQMAALRQLRESVMTANAAIACKGV